MRGLEDFMTIQALVKRGVYLCDIAEQLGGHPKTVSRAVQRGGPPTPRRGRRGSLLDPYRAVIDGLLAEGVWNVVVIWRELQARGYAGEISIIRDYLRPKRALRPGGPGDGALRPPANMDDAVLASRFSWPLSRQEWARALEKSRGTSMATSSRRSKTGGSVVSAGLWTTAIARSSRREVYLRIRVGRSTIGSFSSMAREQNYRRNTGVPCSSL
jgi:hypothetical protein